MTTASTNANASSSKSSAEPRIDPVAQATETMNTLQNAARTCCQGATDAFKTYTDANQKFFAAVAKAWNPTAMWGSASAPLAHPVASQFVGPMTAAFDAMVKSVNGVVDANARFVTECNAIMIDAVRTNVRSLERTGTLMLDQARTGTVTGNSSTKPSTDVAREILDEASSFMTKTGERIMKMNAEHVQQMSKVMEASLAEMQASTRAASCCKA